MELNGISSANNILTLSSNLRNSEENDEDSDSSGSIDIEKYIEILTTSLKEMLEKEKINA